MQHWLHHVLRLLQIEVFLGIEIGLHTRLHNVCCIWFLGVRRSFHYGCACRISARSGNPVCLRPVRIPDFLRKSGSGQIFNRICRIWRNSVQLQWVQLITMKLQRYTLDGQSQEAQLLLGDRATRKHAKDCWNGRGNDNLGWRDLQVYFKVIKSRTNRKLVNDFLLVVYSNFCRITHRFWEIWCETVQWPWNIPKVIDSCIICKLSCGHVKCWEDSERMKRKSPF